MLLVNGKSFFKSDKKLNTHLLINCSTIKIIDGSILYSPNLNALENTVRTLFSVFFFALGIFKVVNWILKNKSRNQERSSNEN